MKLLTSVFLIVTSGDLLYLYYTGVWYDVWWIEMIEVVCLYGFIALGLVSLWRWIKMAKIRVCIGFGKFTGKCENIAGTKWSPHWCERCNKLRLEHLSKRFQEIVSKFKQWAIK